ncbi:LacI family DNA-binding transcriptional regulator [Microbacterium sp. NPDC055683]
MPATMRDVAELAGVSVKTVSNVINGYPYIKVATRERVETAIAQLSYEVNVTARNLRRGSTGVIGLALPELSLPYFAELADSVMDAGHRAGLTVVIERTRGDRDEELAVLTSTWRSSTDGLLFSPLGMTPEDEPLIPDGAPIVLLGERVFSPRFDHVTMDNIEGARAATARLIALGRRRIAAIGVHPGEAMGSAALRFAGYRAALAEAGIPDDPRLHGATQLWHRPSGAAAMASVLDRGVVPDAVVAFNDALGLGAMHELQLRGYEIPRDVLLIGFDDIEETRYARPTMSSVDPGREFIADTAVRLLRERIAGGTASSPRLVTAPHRVIDRASTTLG